MQTLTKKEWVAVVVVLVVVIIFFGSKLLMGTQQIPAADQLGAVDQGTVQNVNVDISQVATTTINDDNNNMNNNQNAGGVADVSGFVVTDTVIGTGAEAKAGDLVSVQYTGKFADGKVFDSSIPRGQPIEFVLGAGQVIKGWDQGILGMKVGGKRSLTIPATLGYGAAGYPPVIPGNATLYFDVELVGVQTQ